MGERTYRIAFDYKLRRPGCALLQAALGCNWILSLRFPADSWIVAPTPDLRVYRATKREIDRLVAMVEAKQKEGR